MKVPAAFTVALIMSLGSAFAEDSSVVYKWVDENGIPQYTDRPPSDGAATRTSITSRRTDPVAVQARVDQQSDINAARAAQRQEQSDDMAAEAASRAETRSQRQANCEQAREQDKTYATSRRLYRPLPDGEREYLTDEELTKARADAKAAVREWCD